jgi:hypothetical protein
MPMNPIQPRPIFGHVVKRKGKPGSVWYAKYQLPHGRQQQKRMGAGLDAALGAARGVLHEAER